MNIFNDCKWIAGSKAETGPAPLFRKKFEVYEPIKKAVLYACGLGYGDYTINGFRVTDDVLVTPVTKYDSTVMYNKYDVTKLIRNGFNVICTLLGNGCYCVTYPRWDNYKAPWFHHPKVILCIKIEFRNGKCIHIGTDTSWKTCNSPIVYNETRRGEIYDARLEINDLYDADYDDSTWDNAFICRSPGGVMKEATISPIRVTKELEAKKISSNVYDLEQNISGWIKFSGKGERGREIIFRYAERINDDKSINPEELNTILGSRTHEDRYIMSGNGIETWAPRFAYHGFRYVEVTNAPEDFKLTGQVVHTDLKIISNFECSNEMLNKIHSAARWSTLTNMHGFPTDCPQREQNAWTGDALLSADQTLFNYNAVDIYKKWLGDIIDAQRPNGEIPCIAPTGGWGYNWGNGPAWDSLLIHLPYLIYKYCGDKSAIHDTWENMNKYMDFMDSMSEGYMVDYGLGDWLAPNGTDVCPSIITDTCYYYSNCRIMAHCAALTDQKAENFLQKAANIKNAFRNRFLKDDLYLGNRQTSIAAAIYFGMYNENELPLAVNRLKKIIIQNGKRFATGVLGTKYMFTVLCENDLCNLMYDMVTNPKMPSYAYWINNGMTTLCEYWDMSHSCNHHMYSEVDMWLYKYIAGIRIAEGAKSVFIKPCFIDSVDYVRANHRNIMVEWDKERIQISSDIPASAEINGKVYNLGIGVHTISRI